MHEAHLKSAVWYADALGNAAAAFSAQIPLLVAFFTFKGGVGKTTLTVLLATILAKMGFTAIIIDADRQCDITIHFQENPEHPQKKDQEVMHIRQPVYRFCSLVAIRKSRLVCRLMKKQSQ